MKELKPQKKQSGVFYPLLLTLMLLNWYPVHAQDLQTGEWAFQENGAPAMVGQTTNDHLFTRNDYSDEGSVKTYDNVVSFKSGAIQTVWFWLDDDEIYLNEAVQALPPIPYNSAGDLYNEITYSVFQCDLYVPQSIKVATIENEDGDELKYAQGDRMPNGDIFEIGISEPVTVDGITYDKYVIVCSSMSSYGIHFSARNGNRYRTYGALRKDDAALFGLYLWNLNQNEQEGHLPDIIIANLEFGLCEPFLVEPRWSPNEYRFIFGEGGNNETQRFQYYNRIALFGSKGIETEMPLLKGDVDGDGFVTIDDVTCLITRLLRKEPVSASTDIDGDGAISINDVVALINYLLRGHWD